MKTAFLDRDGTIVKDYPSEQWTHIESPEFLEGSIKALNSIISKGYEIIIVTNQYIIGEGFISQDQYESFTSLMLNQIVQAQIRIKDIFYCPHARAVNCRSTKPNPGMIEKAQVKYPEIDIENSFLVGDSYSDILLAEYFNLKSYSIGFETQFDDCTQVESLLDVIELIK